MAALQTMASLLKTSKADLAKAREAAETDKELLRTQIFEMQTQLDQANLAGDSQLRSLKEELASLHVLVKSSDEARHQQERRLQTAADSQASLEKQMQAAKRQIATMGLDHEVACAKLEKALKDQADQNLEAVLADHKQELAEARWAVLSAWPGEVDSLRLSLMMIACMRVPHCSSWDPYPLLAATQKQA